MVDEKINENYKRWHEEIEHLVKPVVWRFNQLSEKEKEDLLADVRDQVVNNLARLKNPEKIKAWSQKIALNKCNSYLQRSARYQDVTSEYAQTVPRTTDVNERKEASIRVIEKIEEELEQLGDKYEKTIIGVFVEGKLSKQVAEEENVDPTAISQRIRKLKDCLKKRVEEGDIQLNEDLNLLFGWKL